MVKLCSRDRVFQFFLVFVLMGCTGSMNQNDVSGQVRLLGQVDHCERSEPGADWWSAASASGHLSETLAGETTAVKEAGNQVLGVFLGQRPTPGYGASLKSTRLENGRLVISLEARTPDPGRMMAQVITTPCVLLEVPGQGWAELEVALDAEGFPVRVAYPNES